MNDRPKRITERQAAEGDDARMAALLAGELRVGTLQGVQVDLRHPELPQGEWEAAPWWYVWPNAGIVFPGEAQFGMKKLRQEKRIGPETPAVFACEGDSITIERVEVQTTDKRFDHPHDREQRIAFLRIDRPTGEVLRPDRPLVFYGVGHIKGAGKRSVFDHVVERIMRHAGVSSLPKQSPPWPLWEQPLEIIALESAREAHEAFFDVERVVPEGTAARGALRFLINEAALAGFLLGKIEARTAERLAAGPAKGAQAGAKKVTRLDWREAAQQFWTDHPNWSVYAVAKAVKGDTDDLQSSIERAIAPLCPQTSTSYPKLKARGVVG